MKKRTKRVKQVKLEYPFAVCFTTRGKTVSVKLNQGGLSSNWRATGVRADKPETFDHQTLDIPDNPVGALQLQTLRGDVIRILRERQILRKRPDPRLVLDIAFGTCSHEGTEVLVVEAILKYGQYHEKRFEAGMVGLSSKKHTARHIDLLVEFFTNHPAYRRNVSFSDLRPVLADDLMLWLRSKPRSFCHNYALKPFSLLKTVINYSVSSGWADRNPIAHVKPKKEKKQVVNLDITEINRLKELNLPEGHLNQTRWIFLFCVYTGLSYIDASTLTDSHMVERGGVRCILKNRVKSDQTAFVPIFPDAAVILDMFSNDAMCRLQGRLLPVLSNAKTNVWLKALGAVAGIKFPLTSHVARRSFTAYAEGFDFTMDEMGVCLGHSHSTMTSEFYHKRRQGKVLARFKAAFPDQVNTVA